MSSILINQHQYLELEKLSLGAFHPLKGFMTQAEFRSVVDNQTLPDGTPFPIPVILDVTVREAHRFQGTKRCALIYQGQEVGKLFVEGVYPCDKLSDAKKIFGTTDSAHPGVAYFLQLKEVFVGGRVRCLQRAHFDFSGDELTPKQTRDYFKKKGWRTVVGFQTRNIPHRAHEYLLRLALEHADGVFIQPLVGFKKVGDYTPEAILGAYRALINQFLPKDRILLGVLSTAMRYAGPREAVFHALIRRNYGCTHFIIGRDHAGVGNYYGKYEAHSHARRFDGKLGINILYFSGPFFCSLCDGVVTDRTCPHETTEPGAVHLISGTDVRNVLQKSNGAVHRFVRPEVLEGIRGIPPFIREETL